MKKIADYRIKVTVEIPNRTNLEMTLHPQDCVISIKNEIFQIYGLFSNFYKLYFNNLELEDSLKCLRDYGIKSGSIIKLKQLNALQINKNTFTLKSEP